jgi:hypothetical protein
MLLHLGVIDIPYADAPKSRRSKTARGTQTTGDVAGWLEARYHVMETFFELHDQDVANDLANGLSGALENMMTGRSPLSADPFLGATSAIEDRFKKFLSDREMEQIGYPGVPTMAAQMGVNHRLKRPYKRRPARPSFVDTGLYSASFKSWVD